MAPRIAIPVPHSGDPAYAERALPQYEQAVEAAGGEPVRIPLGQPPAEAMKLIESCDAVLLPGSKADVDPEKYNASRHPNTAAADVKRDTVDELLLQDAYNMRKPILGICYGLQILNVYRSGTLVQHIESQINHAAGRTVPVAHAVEVNPGSKLAAIVASGAEAHPLAGSNFPRLKPGASTVPHESAKASSGSVHGRTASATEAVSSNPGSATEATTSNPGGAVEGHGFSRATKSAKERGALAPEGGLVIPVNSSHHQAAEVVGDGLRVVARCPQDGIIEAVEGTSPDHFVLAVQWHPERSVKDEPSRAIFRSLVEAAQVRQAKLAGEFESV